MTHTKPIHPTLSEPWHVCINLLFQSDHAKVSKPPMLYPQLAVLRTLYNLPFNKVNHSRLPLIPTKEHSPVFTLPHHPSQLSSIPHHRRIILLCIEISK